MSTITYYGWYDDRHGDGPVWTLSTSPSVNDNTFIKENENFIQDGTVTEVGSTTIKCSKYYSSTLYRSSSYDETVTIQDSMSKFSIGANTYIIKDATARASISNLATVATTGSYNDLSNKPTIPTVNNATLTIQKNGTNVATFTANASSNVTANISVPNIVSSVSSSSTNADAVGAKLFYDTVGDIETALHAINSGGSTVTVSIYAYGSTISNATVTIGDETFTNLVAGTTYTFEADKNESYTLRFASPGRAVTIEDSDGNTLVDTYADDVSYTFTATSDVTYKVYSSTDKV